jgi:hypothetical protein
LIFVSWIDVIDNRPNPARAKTFVQGKYRRTGSSLRGRQLAVSDEGGNERIKKRPPSSQQSWTCNTTPVYSGLPVGISVNPP